MREVLTENYQLTFSQARTGKELKNYLDDMKQSNQAKQLSVSFPVTRDSVWDAIGSAVAQSTITTFNAINCKWNCTTIKVFFDKLEGQNKLTSINLSNNQIRSVGADRILRILQSAPQVVTLKIQNNPIPNTQKNSIINQLRANRRPYVRAIFQLCKAFGLNQDIRFLIYNNVFDLDPTSSGLRFFRTAKNPDQNHPEKSIVGMPCVRNLTTR